MVKADIKRNYYADLELPNVRLLARHERASATVADGENRMPP
jgi:hypothetical protein